MRQFESGSCLVLSRLRSYHKWHCRITKGVLLHVKYKINFCYSCEHANLINFLFSFLLLIVMSSRRLVRISENFFFVCRRVCFLSSSNFSLNIHKNLIILFIQIYSKKINFLIYWSRMTTRFICVTSLNIANLKLWKNDFSSLIRVNLDELICRNVLIEKKTLIIFLG